MTASKKPAEAAVEQKATEGVDDAERIDMNVPSALASNDQAAVEG